MDSYTMSLDPSVIFFSEPPCGSICNQMDMFGPPPDNILNIPPPPLPSFLESYVTHNATDKTGCNLCGLLYDREHSDYEQVPVSAVKSDVSWIILLMSLTFGSAITVLLFILFAMKCKRWRIFPVSDACPILPGSFLSQKVSSTDKRKDSYAKKNNLEVKKYWDQDSSQGSMPYTNGKAEPNGFYKDGSNAYFYQDVSNGYSKSPVYAELDLNDNGSINSSISSQAGHFGVKARTAKESYDNAAYISSESQKILDQLANSSKSLNRQALIGIHKKFTAAPGTNTLPHKVVSVPGFYKKRPLPPIPGEN